MVASNFIIFFDGKEGTSALLRLLNNFEQLSIVRPVDSNGKGWEPFDIHNCGPITLKSLEQCFDLLYGHNPINIARLNKIYTQTAMKPLEEIDASKSIGFKMHFRPKKELGMPLIGELPVIRKTFNPKFIGWQKRSFKKVMFGLLKKYRIVTFIAVRQDVFRWALSRYHGDGFGNKRGHLQFRIADRSLKMEALQKIHVNCDQLASLISDCERILQKKRNLMSEFERASIKTYPLLYEKFCHDKFQYFEEMFSRINLPVSREEIDTALGKGSYFKKVHSDDISSFVVNHEEIIDKFGNRFVEWC
jgi:hypothetical protein